MEKRGRPDTTGSAPLRLPGGRLVSIVGDSADQSVLGQLRQADGEWEPHVRAVFERLVRRDWVCVDVGANIGPHTIGLAALAAHVIAFEASPENARHLRENVRAAGVEERTTVVLAALWDRATTLDVVWSAEFAGAAYVSPSAAARPQTTRHPQIVGDDGRVVGVDVHPVSALRLDEWVNENPLDRLDLIKVDVEGAESLVLSGASTTLRTFRPVLVTEYNPECATTLFGASRRDYFDWLRRTFVRIDVIEPDGDLSRVRRWGQLDRRLHRGRGWEDLLCSSVVTDSRGGRRLGFGFRRARTA